MHVVLRALLILGGLCLVPTPVLAGPATSRDQAADAQPVEAVLLRATGVEAAVLLDALQLRSPQRTLAIPPWPPEPGGRFGLFAVASVRLEGTTLRITVVLSDGRAYYRTLEAEVEGAPRVAASTIANLMAAIEEDALPPDEEDVPLPPEQDDEPEPEIAPEPASEPEPETTEQPEVESEPPPSPPLELEPLLAGTVGVALGPPSPAGFVGGGGTVGIELRWPAGALISVALRSHWHRPVPLTVARTRLSVGGGYAWRRGRFELRSVLALDIEPWGVRQDGAREEVGYPDGQRRGLGLQLGGHARVVPAVRVPVGDRLHLRVGPRLEVAGSALAQAGGIARLRLLGAASDDALARVGGLELSAGIELGLAWSLPARRD